VDPTFFIKVLSGLFAIMNPFLALPMFLSLTDGYDHALQRRTAVKVTVSAAALCGVLAVGGTWVLSAFGIGIDNFRIAGGVVLMTIALGMLSGTGSTAHRGTPDERAEHRGRDDVSFYPMAFPMVVGPGTITTIIVFVGQARSAVEYGAILAALAIVLLMLLAVLWLAADIGKHMSMTPRLVTIRLMGMILAAIAVEMMTNGLKAVLPGLAG